MAACRIDLSSRCKKTKMCKFFLANMCARGDNCTFAHYDAELRAIPDLRCTQLCPKLVVGSTCTAADCQFAHCTKELKKFPVARASPNEVARPTGQPKPADLATISSTIQRHSSSDIMPLIPGLMPASACISATSKSSHDSRDLNHGVLLLRQAQEAVSNALSNLELRLKCSMSRSSTSASSEDYSSQQGTSLESNTGAPQLSESDVASKSVLHKPALRPTFGKATVGSTSHQGNGFDLNASGIQALESDEDTESFSNEAAFRPEFGKTTGAFWPMFGRQVSDSGTVFDRQTSYCSPPDRIPGEHDAYASMGLCVKNTFLSTMEEPEGSACRRMHSAPGRCAPEPLALENGAHQHIRDKVGEPASLHQESSKIPLEIPDLRAVAHSTGVTSAPLPVGRVMNVQDDLPVEDREKHISQLTRA
eukprot:TRINITY_DN13354_c0_g1_i1.p1 TRINITY_DN13354_c0_g1~~TRINITY_DN13354_c0_g1_i1.p1  ORF type:complete len:442 (+),score=52.68 TRINITY_DN13354_c0_g1_i1:66-1328(+)